ncbi:glutathione S-transferase [Sclerotinia borealis F-4128]|uniref:Glutathione S-transferase n=1 Tax=Sclerotinia borealis (strain F-4128) TaxID=1432307 RepID=W9CK16_SCLBF|nr:glutathione S-transferase [Sclerotinia borealis F-4128]
MPEPQIKFYWAPGACSLCPHVLLFEAGLPFESITNSVTKANATFVQNFSTINPKMRVPVLSLNSEIITETPAIVTAISSLAPELYLMGRTTMDTIRVYEWLNWLSGTLHGHAFGGILRPERMSDDKGAFEGIEKKGLRNVQTCFDMIEGKLNGIWAVGNALTAVDSYLFVFYRWGEGVGLDMRKEYPKYTVLMENLRNRPSFEKVVKLEKLEAKL